MTSLDKKDLLDDETTINSINGEESSDEMLLRKDRLEALRELDIDPFGKSYDRSHSIAEVISSFTEMENRDQDPSHELGSIRIAGRMMNHRGMGKAIFGNLQDLSGSIQFYLRRDSVAEKDFLVFEKLYVGDLLGLEGTVFRTGKGEITLRVSRLTLLACSLRPLPEKHHGLRDVELRYRKRYVDLIVNETARDTFKIRSRLITTFRKILDNQGYLEVETPVLNHMAGGAAARPFITYHNTLKKDFYLRIATELHLKRLIVGGLEKVYEIGRIFRNEGVSVRHNPEFTTIELYEAYSDYEGMMNLAEELITTACLEAKGSEKIEYQGTTIDFSRPWKRMRYLEALEKFGGVNEATLYNREEVISLCKKHQVDVDLTLPLPKLWDELFDTIVQPNLIQPTFITDYPLESSPLARRLDSNPNLTCRFEAFVVNMEVANAYTELNDPIDQLHRFELQQLDREQGDDEAHGMDLDFVEALEYGMPPTGGMGIGIDRVAMVLSNNSSIREVILFPHLRTK